MNDFALAFLTGLIGSVHCLGMCGPLAFAVPSQKRGWLLVWDKLSYQLGRTISYMLLGLVAGLIGRQLWLAGFQQTISIISGILIILAACSAIFKFGLLRNSFIIHFSKIFAFAFKKNANHLLIGMLNGLLPCGFVSLALAGAINIPTVTGAITYMFLFGLGTIPLMLLATLGIGWVSPLFRRRITKIVPYLMLCLGGWFIVRGSSLVKDEVPGIKEKEAVSVCK